MTTTTLTTSNTAAMTESNSTLEIPSYISSRSANSLISFSRPTRIQAITLEALNRILDELLLLILSSAKSLATDRIKSDGILRVLGGQSGSGSGAGALLAKNAVLEAELELRSYLDGQRKEGGKMPLGLSATSRWDGTEGFPVQSAYKALRIRCQYYSTLGELEDPSPNSPQEQNIMSSDGRPIATITPGVAIYVTALLEFVAEYILQNVARVIERDNSDEATLNDLIKAMEEDEGTLFWWNKMQSRKFIQNLDKENKSGGIGKGKVQKPWQVPDADEYDQAAGKKKFQRQSMASITPSHSSSSNNNILNNSTNSRTAIHDRTSSSGHNDVRNGASESPTLSHQTHTTGITSIPSGSTESNTLKRRTSFDKRGLFGRRRGSFRSSQDLGLAGLGVSGTGLPSNNGRDSNISQSADDNYNAVEGDDFDSLVMSGQTMKVSLTPNRLRSMDVSADGSQDSESAKRSARKRPGTGNLLRAETPNTLSTREGTSEDQVPPRPGSRTGSVIRPSSSRGHGKAAPPSAYRGPEGENRAPDHLESSLTDEAEIATGRNKALPIHTPSPPSPGTGSFAQNGRESRMSLVSQTSTDTQSKRMTLSGAGGKVLGFFGRRSTTSNSSISPSTSANVSVDPSLQRTHTGSTFRSVKGIQRPNGGSGGVGVEENYNDSRSATPSVAHETRKENRESISATSIVAMEREPSDHAKISPELQRMNGKIQEERRESSTGHEEPLSNDDSPNVNEPAQTTSGGIVGLYSEPKANASASTLSSVHNRDSTSRKVVPWSYRRRSSGPIINAANRVGSGAGSSTGHGVGGGESGAPPSAWSQNNFDTTGSGNHANNAGNTPTIGVSPSFGGRTSPSPRPFSMGNSKTDVARLLVQLNQRMRECNNVEECQKLVMQALALTAAAVHTENDPSGTSTANPPQSANSDALPLSTVQPPQKEEEEVELQTNKSQMKELDLLHSVPQYRSVNYRNLALPMSVGYNPTEDDNLPSFQEQGLIASWLLGNEGEEPEVFEAIKQQNEKSFTPLPRRQSLSVNNRRSSKSSFYTKNRSSRQNSVSSIGQESDFASADERPQSELKNSSSLLTTAIENNTNQNNKSNSTTNSNKSPQFFTPNPQQSEIGFVDENDQHRISLAGSVNSNYRDATEEAVNDVD